MEARSYPELVKAIDEAFAQVTLKNLRNWFAHCCYGDSPA